ncbi:MAG: Ferric siderophore transport system, periplasmic binding protein TonB [Ignavibacteriae bacterium]|nr:MAG: Ferric siderophore transport system, periplasmic binding protein TonB [Ignavibacteriota bacterium]
MDKQFEITLLNEKQIRLISTAGTIIFHLILFLLLALLRLKSPQPMEMIELEWGSSSGAPNQSSVQEQTEIPQTKTEKVVETGAKAEKAKVDLPVTKSESDESIALKNKKKADKIERKPSEAVKPEHSKVPRVNRSAAAGAGKTTGYSIEWSGVGFRKLLSGRMPVYPEGTDKEMPVVLQFTVMPDGSVTSIVPVRRSDEILEREAISALKTWRFDPLPAQYEQVPQIGKVTFNFKLE